MSRAGRKRKAMAQRHPNGKIRQVKEPPPVLPHRVGFSPMEMKASTVHGRYCLKGLITDQQHRAGELFIIERNRYRAAMMSPDTLRRAGSAQPPEMDDAEVIASFETLRDLLGRHVVDLEWILTMDVMLTDLTSYREGLDILKSYYRL